MNASDNPLAVHVRRAGQWAMGAAVLTIGLITYGAWVRVSGAGLGCPDWPLCEGVILPELEGATAIEFGHRVYAGVTMIATALAAWYGFRGRAIDPRTNRLFLWALAAIVAQAGLGGATVLTELHGMVRLAHLTFSLLTLALLTIGALQALGWTRAALPGVRRTRALLVATAFVVLVGGSIVGTNSSAGCPTLPLCDGSVGAENLTLHMLHRAAASALLLTFFFTAWQVWRRGGLGLPFTLSLAAGLVSSAQFAVGVTSIAIGLYPELRVLHLAFATLLWWVVVIHFGLALHPRRR
ncbi:MAG: COX15/CtaA family protein [Chloroflexi bacterium]|nr:COX15/CtaA family protein [Chloroflexota bacterium]